MAGDDPELVPDEDWLCLFVEPNPNHWNLTANRPNANAFKANRRVLSLFSEARVVASGNDLDDLARGSLDGHGQALLRAADFRQAVLDYRKLALQAKEKNKIKSALAFDLDLIWRPDNVPASHAKWREAHAEAESNQSPRFPQLYRLALSYLCTRSVVPPLPRSGIEL